MRKAATKNRNAFRPHLVINCIKPQTLLAMNMPSIIELSENAAQPITLNDLNQNNYHWWNLSVYDLNPSTNSFCMKKKNGHDEECESLGWTWTDFSIMEWNYTKDLKVFFHHKCTTIINTHTTIPTSTSTLSKLCCHYISIHTASKTPKRKAPISSYFPSFLHHLSFKSPTRLVLHFTHSFFIHGGIKPIPLLAWIQSSCCSQESTNIRDQKKKQG